MMSSALKWLMVIHLLLSDQTLGRAPSPPPPRLLPGAAEEHQDGSEPRPSPPSDRVRSAERLVRDLREKLQTRFGDHLPGLEGVSCGELLSAGVSGDQASPLFPQELLAFSLAPVLAMAGCWQEARAVVLRLYDLLGATDAKELLLELEEIMERRPSLSGPAASQSAGGQDGRRMEAVMFNIRRLASEGESAKMADGHCDGWIRVNGTSLVGRPAAAATGDLGEALERCETLGDLCAGVTSGGPPQTPQYKAVMKMGSGVLPSESPGSEIWIRQCDTKEDPAPAGRRSRRGAGRCINEREERVYHVMEWIPAVSTLYNLGTAVYYASVDCSQTAKQRAILSAVDLGTDAIMVATGGTAGVAGFALGAGVKTGVKAGIKYLFKSMREEDDVLVNQFAWEDGVFTTE